tara:strand:+ start:1401 stop:1799 length:399 start_codon:yes stop_codon:yes gene_type:complete
MRNIPKPKYSGVKKNIVRLKETELVNLIKRVVNEQSRNTDRVKSTDLEVAAEIERATYGGLDGLPKDSPFPGGSEPEHEVGPEMTHNEFMDQLEDLCPEIIKGEKMVGNRSCKRCHTDTMTLLNKYCTTRSR